MIEYNKRPKNLGSFACQVEEYMTYIYLPIHIPNMVSPIFEQRLKVFEKIIGAACCDFIGDFGLDRYMESYVYVTAKHQFQKLGSGFNRPGWHSDGFMTDDISYVWSNKQPTIFNDTCFLLSQNDTLSMDQMEEQAKPEKNYSFPNESLLRMDQYSIHKVAEYEGGNRAFVKICFSKDKYNLCGNSINYEIDYNWEFKKRLAIRNIPQQ